MTTKLLFNYKNLDQKRRQIKLLQTLFDLGLALGSVIMGVLIAYWGYAVTYLFCAMMTLVTLMVYRVKVAAKVVSVQQEGEH